MSVKSLQTIWDRHLRFYQFLMLLNAEYEGTNLRVQDWDFRRMLEEFRGSIISYSLECAAKGFNVEYDPEKYHQKGNPLKDLNLEEIVSKFKSEVLDMAGDLAMKQIKTNAGYALGRVSEYIKGDSYEINKKPMQLRYFRKDEKLHLRVGMESYQNTLSHYSMNYLEALGRLIDVLFNKVEPEKSKDHWFRDYYKKTGRYGDGGKEDMRAFEKVNSNLESPVVSFKAYKNGRFDLIFNNSNSSLRVARFLLEAKREREKEIERQYS